MRKNWVQYCFNCPPNGRRIRNDLRNFSKRSPETSSMPLSSETNPGFPKKFRTCFPHTMPHSAYTNSMGGIHPLSQRRISPMFGYTDPKGNTGDRTIRKRSDRGQIDSPDGERDTKASIAFLITTKTGMQRETQFLWKRWNSKEFAYIEVTAGDRPLSSLHEITGKVFATNFNLFSSYPHALIGGLRWSGKSSLSRMKKQSGI